MKKKFKIYFKHLRRLRQERNMKRQNLRLIYRHEVLFDNTKNILHHPWAVHSYFSALVTGIQPLNILKIGKPGIPYKLNQTVQVKPNVSTGCLSPATSEIVWQRQCRRYSIVDTWFNNLSESTHFQNVSVKSQRYEKQLLRGFRRVIPHLRHLN